MNGPICILDTTIMLNLLDVPGRNKEVISVDTQYKKYVELDASFVLPVATVVETGNHIAKCGDGNIRRKFAYKFCEQVQAALKGNPPFMQSESQNFLDMLNWIDIFPDHVNKGKQSNKKHEGISFGDLSLIEEFNKFRQRFRMSEILIWSLDSDLISYHYHP